jgi:hypothetical protein
LGNIDTLVSRKGSENAACQNVTDKITDSLCISEITEEDLLKIINSMKNKKFTAVDVISSYVLKKCATYMIRPPLEIINATIKNDICPSRLKKFSGKTDFQKRGTTDDVDSCHPITLVLAVSMLLEKRVAKQLVSFLDKHNIINYSQFGFRKNKSTNDAIALMVDTVIECQLCFLGFIKSL